MVQGDQCLEEVVIAGGDNNLTESALDKSHVFDLLDEARLCAVATWPSHDPGPGSDARSGQSEMRIDTNDDKVVLGDIDGFEKCPVCRPVQGCTRNGWRLSDEVFEIDEYEFSALHDRGSCAG
jgi:hypothetical protein